MHRFSARHLVVMSGLATALLMAACSDGSLGLDDSAEAGRARPLALAPPTAYPTAPLLDDQGHLYPTSPQALPADTGARTRGGLYATPSQAAQLEGALGVMAIPVNVEPGSDSASAVDLATLVVFGLQAAHDLPPDAPVLVRSSDLRLAAATVNRLAENGFTRVFLVNHEAGGGLR
jgi:hypothetical protein